MLERKTILKRSSLVIFLLAIAFFVFSLAGNRSAGDTERIARGAKQRIESRIEILERYVDASLATDLNGHDCIDGLPEDAAQRKKHMKKLGFDFRLLSWKRMSRDKKLDIPHKLILLAAKSVLHIVPVRVLVRMLERDVKKYSYADSAYVGHLVSPSPWGTDIKPKAVFEKPARHTFEESEFFVPGDVASLIIFQ